jgi:hypothetical protein
MEDATARVPLSRTPADQADEDAFLALYGYWAPLTPAEFAAEMEGFERPWWVVGGWAIEAATGYRREHEDTDVSILATFLRSSSSWKGAGTSGTTSEVSCIP